MQIGPTSSTPKEEKQQFPRYLGHTRVCVWNFWDSAAYRRKRRRRRNLYWPDTQRDKTTVFRGIYCIIYRYAGGMRIPLSSAINLVEWTRCYRWSCCWKLKWNRITGSIRVTISILRYKRVRDGQVFMKCINMILLPTKCSWGMRETSTLNVQQGLEWNGSMYGILTSKLRTVCCF